METIPPIQWFCPPECGFCCGLVGLDPEVFEKHKNKVQRKIVKRWTVNGKLYLATEDRYCLFLNPEGRCVIYEDRPKICRDFGITPGLECPFFDLKGVPIPEQEVEARLKWIEQQNKERMEKDGWFK